MLKLPYLRQAPHSFAYNKPFYVIGGVQASWRAAAIGGRSIVPVEKSPGSS
jgi:hypothetical protein